MIDYPTNQNNTSNLIIKSSDSIRFKTSNIALNNRSRRAEARKSERLKKEGKLSLPISDFRCLVSGFKNRSER